MLKWLKCLLLIAAVFGVIWGATIEVWRSTNRTPDVVEIALCFLGLPVLVLLAGWGGFALARRIWQKPATPAAAPQQDNPETASSRQESSERTWSLQIIGSAIRSTHGSTPEELAEKLVSGRTELPLDKQLTDDAGFPILAGRAAYLDEPGFLDDVRHWLAANGTSEVTWRDEDIRTLSLGADVVRELAVRVVAHPLLPDYLAGHPGRQGTLPLPALQILACLPPWQDDKRKLALAWFLHILEQQNWPAEKIVLGPLADGASGHPFQLIDRLCLTTRRQSLPCFAMLLTCMSDVGEETVGDWSAQHKLLNADNKSGLSPGEGAAALLLADHQQSAFFEDGNAATMHRVVQTRRDKPIDESRRVTADLLVALANDSLSAAGISAHDVGMLISNCSQGRNRTTEVMLTGSDLLPDLDPAKDYALVGVACATSGAVSSALALSLAHQKAVSDRITGLCLSNEHPLECLAAVVTPVETKATLQK